MAKVWIQRVFAAWRLFSLPPPLDESSDSDIEDRILASSSDDDEDAEEEMMACPKTDSPGRTLRLAPVAMPGMSWMGAPLASVMDGMEVAQAQ